ncbi:hypothetical protein H7X65_01870 [Candidatus Parcubacteria bacterium]|nr:hypothetical protein [Candidatus Parcubacteria bacterium]
MEELMKTKKSGREVLSNLEVENKYVFHGSETPDIEMFEPRQAYDFINGEKVKDDEPAIHASEFSDIAILMALINKENCKEGFESGFHYEDKVILSVNQKALDQLNESSQGYVYVFSKEDFKPRKISELISYVHVKPVMMIRVKKSDLSNDLEITN